MHASVAGGSVFDKHCPLHGWYPLWHAMPHFPGDPVHVGVPSAGVGHTLPHVPQLFRSSTLTQSVPHA
jgi:hypothetical protein